MLSNTIKQKRKEKAGKWEVPLPKVRPMAEDEMFKVLKSGKRMKKSWKRMITKVGAQGVASEWGHGLCVCVCVGGYTCINVYMPEERVEESSCTFTWFMDVDMEP